jgi:hypothetical protein
MQRTSTMLSFPPAIACALAVAGIVVFSKVLAREWRRMNAEFDARARAAAAVAGRDLPTLRLDPKTGVYRPQ